MKNKIPTIEIQFERVTISSEGKRKLDGEWRVEIDQDICVEIDDDSIPILYELYKDYDN